eukprot:301643_1
MAEEKKSIIIYDAEDEYQESIVTEGDGRRRIDVFQPQANDIYPCIGQLDIEFDYNLSHKWRGNLTGTGTVIYNKNKTCIVLTAAHNIRGNVIHCTSCNTYRVPKRNNQKTRCAVCKNITGPDQQQKILKATNITFRDRSIEYGNNYGQTLENYECIEVYVPDIKYMNYPKPKDGYDWAFLSFKDSDNIYKKRMEHINVELVEWNAVNKKDRSYAIFGYPNDKHNRMVGMKSKTIKAFELRENTQTKRSYIYQTGIDTMVGQSGSLIWYKDSNGVKVCGIHAGGSKGTKKSPHPYNIGTLVSKEIIKKWKQIKMNDNVKGDVFRICVLEIGRYEVEIMVKWHGIEKCEKSNIVFTFEIAKDKDFVFIDRKMIVRGDNKVKVSGLEENTFYSLRAKRGDMNDEKVADEWWNNAEMISFKTKSDEEMKMDGLWKEQTKAIDSLKTVNIQLKDAMIKIENEKQKLLKEKQMWVNEKMEIAKMSQNSDAGNMHKKGLKKVNNIQQVLEQKDEIKSNYNNNILTKYNGKFIQTNSSTCLTVINPYKIKSTKTRSSSPYSQTAKMDSILPAYNSNSNIIVYWKIQFVDNNKKKGFNYYSYFIGVISDTVSNMN